MLAEDRIGRSGYLAPAASQHGTDQHAGVRLGQALPDTMRLPAPAGVHQPHDCAVCVQLGGVPLALHVRHERERIEREHSGRRGQQLSKDVTAV